MMKIMSSQFYRLTDEDYVLPIETEGGVYQEDLSPFGLPIL